MSLVDFHGYPTLEARNVFRYELEQLASDLKKAMPESKWNEFIKVVSDAVRVCGGPTSAGVGTMLEYCAHARGASS